MGLKLDLLQERALTLSLGSGGGAGLGSLGTTLASIKPFKNGLEQGVNAFRGYSNMINSPQLAIPNLYNSTQYPAPGTLFDSPDLAAEVFGYKYNAASISLGREFLTNIYSLKGKYSFTKPVIGGSTKVSGNQNNIPAGSRFTTIAHSHGNFLKRLHYGNDNFSATDKQTSRRLKVNSYVTTPAGFLRIFYYKTGVDKIIDTNLPYDKTDPYHIN
jgi:Domain of unknown function (DUF4329)